MNDNETTSIDRRERLLIETPGFSSIPAAILRGLAADLTEEKHAAGALIVKEGDAGDKLFFIADGKVEVSTSKSSGAIPLATLQTGEMFGEIALLSEANTRQASVFAVTKTTTLALSQVVFKELLASQSDLRPVLERASDLMIETKFLKRASPFAKIEAARLKNLAQKLERISAKSGAEIVRQGEPGDACYFIFKGSAEIFVKDDEQSAERRVATIGAGSLFGETALLTDAARNATVRLTEDSELLALHRTDLLEAISAERNFGGQMIELMHLRARPTRKSNIAEHQQINKAGEIITILKDLEQHTYYRLSPEGFFIWQRLDGRRNLRDLTLDYLEEFKSFSPAAIAEIVGGLTIAGFVESNSLRSDVVSKLFKLKWWESAIIKSKQILEWQKAWAVDRVVSKLYRGGLRFLFTRIGQIFLAIVALVGILAFYFSSEKAGTAFRETSSFSLFLFLVPAYFFAILIHEAGHALTTKAFGFEVPRAGIGWYWFGPIAFVDTSDIWLANRWQRIAVSLAGPYANLISGSAASLIAWLVFSPEIIAALWQFAFISYFLAIVNLNPLLEYDGYYVLMDWLERPNLRPRALAWLGGELPKVWREKSQLRAHLLEIFYGTGSLVYIIFMGVLTIVSYRLLAQDWMQKFISADAAAAFAWILGAAVVILSIFSVAGELRGAKGKVAK